MNIMANSFEAFQATASRKTIVAFGASDFLKLIALNYKELKLDQCISCIVDNDREKQGGSFLIGGSRKAVIPPDRILECEGKDTAILITSDVYAYEIYMQLKELLDGKKMDIFVLSLMIAKHKDGGAAVLRPEGTAGRIPKMIHYFWFSGAKKDSLTIKCIESWKAACPDYELKEWNADNYDVTKNPFAFQAFRQGKWAYVSDYARLDVVSRYGGVYMDLDVLLYKSLNPLLGHNFFIGFGPIRDVEAAVFGAVKGCPVVKEMLQLYEGREFDPDQSLTLLQLQPALLDRFFEKKGFEINGRYQERDGVALYPRDLFSGKNWFTGAYETTETAIGIHECAGGWVSRNGVSRKQIKLEGNRKLEELWEAAYGKQG